MQDKYKGWIEGFGNVVTEQIGKDTKEKVLDQCTACQAISNDKEMAICVKEVMNKFDKIVPEKERRENVMETMGNYCFSSFFEKTANEVKEKSNGLEEAIQNLNNLMGGEHFKLEDKKVYSTLNQCFCQIGVKETEEPISKTYCNCSLGWMKSLFNTLLDRSVEVMILESIVSGGEACRFVINLE
ncbi:MAG: hypothetical protein KGD73_09280 [Candidatus Lokiarchaeota archaeon]|nr:hypothetical protein [Candidatus Lokiarchaeota archaeon]